MLLWSSPFEFYPMNRWEREYVPTQEKAPRSRVAAWGFFHFDRFSEYPLSKFRRYSEKQSKALAAFCGFFQITKERSELFTKSSHFGRKWHNARAPPSSEVWGTFSTSNFRRQIMAQNTLSIFFQKNFFKVEISPQVCLLRSPSESVGRGWEHECWRTSPRIVRGAVP